MFEKEAYNGHCDVNKRSHVLKIYNRLSTTMIHTSAERGNCI